MSRPSLQATSPHSFFAALWEAAKITQEVALAALAFEALDEGTLLWRLQGFDDARLGETYESLRALATASLALRKALESESDQAPALLESITTLDVAPLFDGARNLTLALGKQASVRVIPAEACDYLQQALVFVVGTVSLAGLDCGLEKDLEEVVLCLPQVKQLWLQAALVLLYQSAACLAIVARWESISRDLAKIE